MHSFVRVVEVWVPDSSGERLVFDSGAYGDLPHFAEDSKDFSFARGSGLPGMAWQAAMPIVMRDLADGAFLRADAAREAGLTSGVAMPIFQGRELRAVLVFLCGDHGHADGAIELWKDDGLSGQSLIDGYYGSLERFQRQSRNIKFPRGRGLPGMVWDAEAPQIVDVGNTNAFLRSQAALDAGISIGIGIPLNTDHNIDEIGFVVTFLSVQSTPIARRFEIWNVAPQGGGLYFNGGIEHPQADILPADINRQIPAGEGPVGRALETGLPCVQSGSGEETGEVSHLAIPVYFMDELRSVVSFSY